MPDASVMRVPETTVVPREELVAFLVILSVPDAVTEVKVRVRSRMYEVELATRRLVEPVMTPVSQIPPWVARVTVVAVVVAPLFTWYIPPFDAVRVSYVAVVVDMVIGGRVARVRSKVVPLLSTTKSP
jgi:hypothetical protein